jgi:hypothetical protein
MKVSRNALSEIKLIRNAVNNAYDKLNITLYEKVTEEKYKEVNPFDSVQENIEYIIEKVRSLENSEIIGD